MQFANVNVFRNMKIYLPAITGLLVILQVNIGIRMVTANNTNSPSIAELVEGIRSNHAQLRSASAEIYVDRHIPASVFASLRPPTDFEDHVPVAADSTEKIGWAFDGNDIIFKSSYINDNNERWITEDIAIGDNHYMFDVSPDGHRLKSRIDRDGMFLGPNPLFFGYRLPNMDGHGLDIGDIIAGDGYVAKRDGSDPRFGPLILVEGVSEPSIAGVYFSTHGSSTSIPTVRGLMVMNRLWIAPNCGYVVVRADAVGPILVNAAVKGRVKPCLMSSRTIEALVYKRGVYFPIKAVSTNYSSDGSIMDQSTITLSNLSINDVSRSTFDTSIPPGILVWDDRKHEMFDSVDGKKLIPDPRGWPDTFNSAVLATSYPARWGFLVGVTLLLVSGIFMVRKWRNR